MFTSLIVKASTPLLTPCFLRRLFDPTPNYINWEEEYKGRKKMRELDPPKRDK